MTARVALVPVAGISLGVLGRLSDYGSEPVVLLFALGSPWIVLGFALGACFRSRREGAAAGASALAISVGAYYVTMLVVEGRAGLGYALAMTLVWGVAALAIGALFGFAGAAARDAAARLQATALLGGALAGEALLFLSRGYRGPEAMVLLAQLAAGAALPLAASGERRHDAVALTGAVALMALVADAAIRLVARRYGWGGG